MKTVQALQLLSGNEPVSPEDYNALLTAVQALSSVSQDSINTGNANIIYQNILPTLHHFPIKSDFSFETGSVFTLAGTTGDPEVIGPPGVGASTGIPLELTVEPVLRFVPGTTYFVNDDYPIAYNAGSGATVGKARVMHRYMPSRVALTSTRTLPMVGQECGPYIGEFNVCKEGKGLLCLAIEPENKYGWVTPIGAGVLVKFKLTDTLYPNGVAPAVFIDGATGLDNTSNALQIYDTTGRAFGLANEKGWAQFNFKYQQFEFVCMEGCLTRAAVVYSTEIIPFAVGAIVIAGVNVQAKNYSGATAFPGQAILAWYQAWDEQWYFISATTETAIVKVTSGNVDGTCKWDGSIVEISSASTFCTDPFTVGADCFIVVIDVASGSWGTKDQLTVGEYFQGTLIAMWDNGDSTYTPVFAIQSGKSDSMRIVRPYSPTINEDTCLYDGKVLAHGGTITGACTDPFTVESDCKLLVIDKDIGSWGSQELDLDLAETYIGKLVFTIDDVPVYAIRVSKNVSPREFIAMLDGDLASVDAIALVTDVNTVDGSIPPVIDGVENICDLAGLDGYTCIVGEDLTDPEVPSYYLKQVKHKRATIVTTVFMEDGTLKRTSHPYALLDDGADVTDEIIDSITRSVVVDVSWTGYSLVETKRTLQVLGIESGPSSTSIITPPFQAPITDVWLEGLELKERHTIMQVWSIDGYWDSIIYTGTECSPESPGGGGGAGSAALEDETLPPFNDYYY